MTTVSMDYTPAAKFTLTSSSRGGSDIYSAVAVVRPKIGDEQLPGPVASACRCHGRAR
jgi:hypothetical protein